METIILGALIFSGYMINENNSNLKKKKKKKEKKILDNIQSNININNSNKNNSNENNLNGNNLNGDNLNGNNLNGDNLNGNNLNRDNLNGNNLNRNNLNGNNLETIYENKEFEINRNIIESNSLDNTYNLDIKDNGFDGIKNYNKKQPEIVHSTLTGSKINFNHNNMQPFYGSNIKQNMNMDKSRRLDLFTGENDLKQPKKEVEPLFENQKQNIYGGQNYSSAYQERINKTRYTKNTVPFEQIIVGNGIGFDYDDKPNGGFHQDIRDYELPKTVDELRTANNPKITYEGRIIKGTKEIKRDSNYNFTKYKKNPMIINRKQEKTTGPQKEQYRSKVILQHTNRKDSKQLIGPKGNTIKKQQKRGKYKDTNKLMLDIDTTRNFNGDKIYEYDKKSFRCLETKREEQSVKPYSLGLYVGNLLKALIPSKHYDDKARKTIKQTTQDNTKNILNLKQVTGGKNQVYNDQKARKTIKQTTQDNTKGLMNLKQATGGKNQLYCEQKARTTIKQTTQDNIKDILNIKVYSKLPKRIQHKIKDNLKMCLLHTPRIGNIVLPQDDKGKKRDIQQLKKTLKETLLKDSELLNLIGNLHHKKYFDDKAKITHKETYADHLAIGQAGQNINDGYKAANYEMIETNKQTTCNISFSISLKHSLHSE